MASKQLETILEAIARADTTTKPLQRSGNGYRAQCPAHGGQERNLYIADGNKRVLMTCHSQSCDPKDILESVGLGLRHCYYQNTSNVRPFRRQRVSHEDFQNALTILYLWNCDMATWGEPFEIDDSEAIERAWKTVMAMRRSDLHRIEARSKALEEFKSSQDGKHHQNSPADNEPMCSQFGGHYTG